MLTINYTTWLYNLQNYIIPVTCIKSTILILNGRMNEVFRTANNW